MPCFMLRGRTLKANASKFSTRSTFICKAKGKGGVWLDLDRFFGQWNYGLHGICICRDQDMKVSFTGWGIQGGSSMMSVWTGVRGCSTRIWNCQSVQTCFNTQCEINLWEMLAADILSRQFSGMLCIAGLGKFLRPSKPCAKMEPEN